MSKIRQILRMYSQGRSRLWIAEQTGVSRNTAKKYMATFDASGLTFEQINSLNDKELDDFFGTVKQQPPQDRLLNLQRCFPQIDVSGLPTNKYVVGRPDTIELVPMIKFSGNAFVQQCQFLI
ncbi:helix-turn-helix domain-containing protein [Dyadobacter sp. LHD-138]|uniref:helix-turn-helix domain-containing protein n=1 Tax=Dyadobacter sp. LHD-138 TaxID=3071413 RepID=UPI0027DED601|nr:helix-turn-helix domain-containing protein [Dyadobacter sp. LHD-138]MDQ6481835.1 helix-turn-helix domain-containing protein [Dyadobacter sp. LHD-138]